MKKEIGYRLFAFMYKICCIFPVQKEKIFCVMTHDSSEEGNVGVVKKYLEDRNSDWKFCCLKREDTKFHGKEKWKKIFFFFIKCPYQLATSAYVFQDNIFLPIAFLQFRKKVKVVQLWHGTGTIKKFGQDVNTGRLKELERLANKSITHLIINSKKWDSYARIFGVTNDKLQILGMPRTDVFFSEDKKEEREEQFFMENPNLIGKKIILYAPTFRDDQLGKQKLQLDIETWLKMVPEDTILGLRLHPFVADNFQYIGKESERIVDFSSYNNLNTLLFISSGLITDYSSIVFEYILLDKPMYFYAYDLEEFSDHGRGFYESYEQYVPGIVARTTEELVRKMLEHDQHLEQREYWEEKRKEFKEENYCYFDGNSTKRLVKRLDME